MTGSYSSFEWMTDDGRRLVIARQWQQHSAVTSYKLRRKQPTASTAQEVLRKRSEKRRRTKNTIRVLGSCISLAPGTGVYSIAYCIVVVLCCIVLFMGIVFVWNELDWILEIGNWNKYINQRIGSDLEAHSYCARGGHRHGWIVVLLFVRH